MSRIKGIISCWHKLGSPKAEINWDWVWSVKCLLEIDTCERKGGKVGFGRGRNWTAL